MTDETNLPQPTLAAPAVAPYKAELERAFLLCTEREHPERVKQIAKMFEDFQTDPLKVVTGVYSFFESMLANPYLQFQMPAQQIAAQGLLTGVLIGAGIQHSDAFRERIVSFAKDHQPDPTKIMTMDEVRARKKCLKEKSAL